MLKITQNIKSITHSRVNALKFIHKYIDENDVTEKRVLDLSAGAGYVANLFYEKNGAVWAFDMYPELFENKDICCAKIDLNYEFPIEDDFADFVLLMETIDHISNQHQLFQEISRIMKPGGKLIITKPNNSNIIGRLANLWLESERSDMFLVNEKTVIGYDENRPYLGRLFLCGIQKLRTLAAMQGLKIHKIYPNQLSVSSVLWFSVVGLFFVFRTYLTYFKLTYNANILEKNTLKEQFEINKNFKVLFHKHLCVEFEKE